MKITILIGSLFACFLMLMIPNISAVESLTIRNSGPDIDKEEMIQAILQRIEELKENNPNPKPCWTQDDPDGPYEGGLDDSYDWFDLIWGVLSAIFVGFRLEDIKEIRSTPLLEIVKILLDAGMYSIVSIIYLADAFDIIDPDKDGY